MKESQTMERDRGAKQWRESGEERDRGRVIIKNKRVTNNRERDKEIESNEKKESGGISTYYIELRTFLPLLFVFAYSSLLLLLPYPNQTVISKGRERE